MLRAGLQSRCRQSLSSARSAATRDFRWRSNTSVSHAHSRATHIAGRSAVSKLPICTSEYACRALSSSGSTPAAVDDPADAVAAPPAQPPTMLKTYMELSKFRLSALVVFTTSAGYLAAGGPIEAVPFSAACIGTMLAACSASSFNQIIEVERDARMKRTQNRPLPSGRVSRESALAFGGATAAASFAVLAAGTNPVVTAFGMGNLFLYAVPYTLSKTRTEANTWIGSLVGALPPLMGWAAATGGDLLAAEPLLLGGMLFLWQFPHFFALSWMYRQDYARGGFKMVPCADPSGQRTASLIARYSLYLTPLPVLAAAADVTSWMFAVEGTAFNLVLLSKAHTFYKERSNSNARDVFKASLWYLPAILTLFVYHSKQWGKVHDEDKQESLLYSQLRVLKAHLKAACVHEMLVSDEAAPGLCPAVVGEATVDKAVDKAKAAVADTAAVATAAAGATVQQQQGEKEQ
jgi:heme o synthase